MIEWKHASCSDYRSKAFQMSSIGASRDEKFPIGTLAKLSDAGIETIRYYERAGLLKHPARSTGGRREYGHADLRTLVFIRRARELGFTLDEIRTLLALGGPATATCAEVRDIAARHLADIRAKLRDLTRLEGILASTVAQCSGERVPECAVLDVLDIDRTGKL
jgi:MerR family transcriptional regulator, mercuric resistance operon regulatory protein